MTNPRLLDADKVVDVLKRYRSVASPKLVYFHQAVEAIRSLPSQGADTPGEVGKLRLSTAEGLVAAWEAGELTAAQAMAYLKGTVDIARAALTKRDT